MATADSLTPRRRRWLLARGLLRAFASAVLMVVLYYTLPLGSLSDVSLTAELSVGVAILVGVVTWQVGAIERATYPAIRATQALAVTHAAVPALLRGQLLHPQRRRRGDVHRDPEPFRRALPDRDDLRDGGIR